MLQLHLSHYGDVIIRTIASQITSLTIVYSTVYSDADQIKHQSSASLAFVWGIHRGPVNSPHKWPVPRKMFPFDNVNMWSPITCLQKCHLYYRFDGIIISNIKLDYTYNPNINEPYASYYCRLKRRMQTAHIRIPPTISKLASTVLPKRSLLWDD